MKSEWPSGLRRYVQVVVYSVGVGSNPTSDSRFLLNVGTNSLLFQRHHSLTSHEVRMAERSKALRSGRSLLCRRGFESHF